MAVSRDQVQFALACSQQKPTQKPMAYLHTHCLPSPRLLATCSKMALGIARSALFLSLYCTLAVRRGREARGQWVPSVTNRLLQC